MRVGNIHESQTVVDVTKIPTQGQTQTLRRCSDPITPCASGTWTTTEEMKKELQTTQRRMTKMIIQTKRKTRKCHAAAARCERRRYRRRRTPRPRQRAGGRHEGTQGPNEHEGISHDADSNSSFDEVPNDDPEDELEPWVDHLARAEHKADDLLAASGITSWIFRQSQIYWKQARMIDKHHEDRWTKLVSKWIGIQRCQPSRKGTAQDGLNGTPWTATLQAADFGKQHDPRPPSQRLRQHNNNAQTKQQGSRQKEDDTKDDDDDDSLLIPSEKIDS